MKQASSGILLGALASLLVACGSAGSEEDAATTVRPLSGTGVAQSADGEFGTLHDDVSAPMDSGVASPSADASLDAADVDGDTQPVPIADPVLPGEARESATGATPRDVNGDGVFSTLEILRISQREFVDTAGAELFEQEDIETTASLAAILGLYEATETGPDGENTIFFEFLPRRTGMIDRVTISRESELRIHDFQGDEAAAVRGVSRNCHVVSVGTLSKASGPAAYVARFSPTGAEQNASFEVSRQPDGLLFFVRDEVDRSRKVMRTFPVVTGISTTDLTPCP